MKALRKKAVAAKCGVSRSQIERWASEERYAHLNFPKPFKLGDGFPGWVEDEIDTWLAARAAQRERAA